MTPEQQRAQEKFAALTRGKMIEAGEGERIVAGTIVEGFAQTSSGALELLTPGSTKPVAEVHQHAGIVRVRRFRLDQHEVRHRG